MKLLILFFLILILAAAAHDVSFSATYYVSPDGRNSNPGTEDNPWATPGYASKQLQAGDTLIIRDGRYVLSEFYADMITPPNSGTQNAWIVIKGEDGSIPVLAGRNNLFSAIQLDGVNYIRIENLEITSDNGAHFREGINAGGNEISHVVFKGLHIHHIDEFGIDLKDVNDLLVDECNIHHCGFGAIGGPAGETGGWRNVLIRGCQLSYGGHYYQGGDGSNRPYDRPDGFGIEPSDGPVEIMDCIVEHNRGDGLDSKAGNTYFHNCIVANNSCDGIKLWGDNSKVHNCLVYGTGDGVPVPIPWAGLVIGTETQNAYFEIINTTIHNVPQTHNHPMYVQYDSPAPITLVVRNSIIAGGYGVVFIGDSVNFIADHNIFYRPGDDIQVYANGMDYTSQQIESGELGQGNLSRDPLFVAPAWGSQGDYHLQQESPGVDAGVSGAGIPYFDLEYIQRPQGDGYDIGAYEYIPGGVHDYTPPAAIDNLSADIGEAGNSVELKWIAPGDDGNTGTASAYIIKFNTIPITESNWSESSDVDNESVPGPAGSSESMTVPLPYPGVIYYFAIKTQDEVPNISPISNSPSARASIKLYAGWNLVAFMPFKPVKIADAMNCIEGKYVSIWTYNAPTSSWMRYIVNGPDFLNNLEWILPGWAYWIFATEDCAWDYGSNIQLSPSVMEMRKPPFIVYGKIKEDNSPESSSDGIEISLRIKNMEAAGYTMGTNARYQDYYVLEVPVDDAFREGDAAKIYLNGELATGEIIKLGGVGVLRRHDIIYMRKPNATMLLQNYPNPFNPETWIPFQLHDAANVMIRIYNPSGQLIRSLDLGYRPAGFYVSKEKAAHWDGNNESGELVTSGVYYYSIKAGDFADTRKMVIVR